MKEIDVDVYKTYSYKYDVSETNKGTITMHNDTIQYVEKNMSITVIFDSFLIANVDENFEETILDEVICLLLRKF